MAIKVIKENTDRNSKYKVSCGCGSVIEYTGSDLRYHRNYPEGYIYCPVCGQPVAHDKKNWIGVVSKEEIDKINQEEKRNFTRVLIVFSVLLLIVAIVFIVLIATRVIVISGS